MSDKQEIQNQIALKEQELAENQNHQLEIQNELQQEKRRMAELQDKVAESDRRLNESQNKLKQIVSDFVLELCKCQKLEDVSELNIAYDFQFNPHFADVIVQCINLKSLKCKFSQISDFALLAGLHDLKMLVILEYKDKDVSFLNLLSQLEGIKLPDCEIDDYSAIFSLSHLKVMEIEPSCNYSQDRLNRLTWAARKSHEVGQQYNFEYQNLTNLRLSRQFLFNICPIQLQGLLKLTSLSLINNNIADLYPISCLLNLVYLDLGNNLIVDIQALSMLNQLNTLLLDGNMIVNLKPLSSLLSLKKLVLSFNQIENIDYLSELRNLEYLSLGYNHISNLFVLTKLSKLTYLSLKYNNITDVNQFFCVLHLPLKELYIEGCQINSDQLMFSLVYEITTLIRYDDNEVTEQLRNQAKNYKDNSDYEQILLDQKQKDFQLSLIQKQGLLSQTFGKQQFEPIALGHRISLLLQQQNHKLLLIIDISEYEDQDTNISTLSEIFPQIQLVNGVILITMPKIEEILQFVLSLKSYQRDSVLLLMSKFTQFHYHNLEFEMNTLKLFKNLHYINISDMQNCDISSIANLSQLTVLDLSVCQIDKTFPEIMCQNLSELYLNHNDIQKCDSISRLSNLIHLKLIGNSIDDVSFVFDLKTLQYLDLSFNNITDIRYLAELKNLQSLKLEKNKLKDISSLANLTNLTILHLQRNQIEDVRPLAGLHRLSQLYIQRNKILDATPIAQLINLVVLRIQGNKNRISDIGQLSSLINVVEMYFNENTEIKEIPFTLNVKQKHLILLNQFLCDYRNLMYLNGFQLQKLTYGGKRNPNNKLFQEQKIPQNFLIYINTKLAFLEMPEYALMIDITSEVRLFSIKNMVYIDKKSLDEEF